MADPFASFLQPITVAGTRTVSGASAVLKLGTLSCRLDKAPEMPVDGRMEVDLDGVAFRAFQSRLVEWIRGGGGNWGGELVACGASRKDAVRLAFPQATLGGLAFPTLNAHFNGPAALRLKFRTNGITSSTARPFLVARKASVPWNTGRFRVTLDGLNGGAVTRVETIEATSSGTLGLVRMEFDRSAAASLSSWLQEAVIGGKNSVLYQKGASIEYQDATGARIATLTFSAQIIALQGSTSMTASLLAQWPTLEPG